MAALKILSAKPLIITLLIYCHLMVIYEVDSPSVPLIWTFKLFLTNDDICEVQDPKCVR